MFCGNWSSQFIALVYISVKINKQQSCLELQRSRLLEAKGMSSKFFLCRAYHKAEQIVCDVVKESLKITENGLFNLTLKSVSFHRGESSSSILLSHLERIIFSLFVGSILLDLSLTQSVIDLFCNSPTLNAVNVITSKLLQMESNGYQ